MSRPSVVLAILAVLSAVLVTAGIGACKRRARDAGPGRVTLVYTGGLGGALEPCGCSPGQLGGVARISTVLTDIRKESPAVIFVDTGDLLFQDVQAPESIRAQLTLKAKFVQKAYGILEVAALNLGARDLVGGLDLAVGGAKTMGASPISANLRTAAGASPVAGSTLIEAGGVRVAFVGLCDPAAFPASPPGGLRAEPPLAPVREAVARVRPEADVVVLLSTLGLDAARELASGIEGIDFVIDAGVGKEPRNLVLPEKVGSAFLVGVKPLGEFMGRIDLALGGARGQPLRNATVSDRIEGMPGTGAPSGTLFGGGLDLRGLSPGRAKPRGEDTPLAPGTFKHRVYALSERYQKNAAMQQLLVDYKHQIADLASKAPVTRARIPTKGPRYIGEETCKDCHRAIYEFVRKSPHAKAYATLERANSEYDLECVGCHVTGWRKPGGFDEARAVGNLKNVQCEVCHGPGSEHVAAGGRGVGGLVAEVPVSVCESCHTPSHSTRFAGKQNVYMDQIRCSRAIGRASEGVGRLPNTAQPSTSPGAEPQL